MAITRLGLSGVTRGRYQTFAGKELQVPVTRLGLSGIPRTRYSSFAGKEQIRVFTRLGLSAIPRSRYGVFSGKELYVPPVEPPDDIGGGGGRPVTRKITRISLDQPLDELAKQLIREDEEVLIVLLAAYKAGII